MLKSLAIGFLTLSAACATAAFANNNNFNNNFNNNNYNGFPFDFNNNFNNDKNYWNDCGKNCDNQNHNQQCWTKCGNSGQPTAAPEIDPAGAMGALTLLLGGLAALRGRRSARPTA